MKPIALSAVLLSVVCLVQSQAAELNSLKALYIGDGTNTTRAKQVTEFLRKNLGQVEGVNRKGFTQEQASAFDVVVLDWPQSDKTEQERLQGSPLGNRTTWTKPTVLLGSAGLNMAIVWQVRGGSG